MPSFYALMGVPPTGFDPKHTYTTSWLLPPSFLAAIRLLIALYCFITIFFSWGWYGTHNMVAQIGQQFSYFTSLTFWGIAFYMLFAGAHTLVYALRGQSSLNRWPRFLQLLHVFLYTTITTLPFLVTIVYWAILYSGTWYTQEYDGWSNISRHALNSIFAFLEIVLPATNPSPWLHIPFLIILLGCYLGLAYVTHATQGWYPYGFLDPANGTGQLAGYIVGIALGSAVLFAIVWCIIWTRRRFTPDGKRSKRDNRRSNDSYGERIVDLEMTDGRSKSRN